MCLSAGVGFLFILHFICIVSIVFFLRSMFRWLTILKIQNIQKDTYTTEISSQADQFLFIFLALKFTQIVSLFTHLVDALVISLNPHSLPRGRWGKRLRDKKPLA